MDENKGRVLIVDDETSIRRLLHQKLTSGGYQCQEAGNAELAMEQLKKGVFGLIILDNKMPGKSGIDFLLELRAAYPDTAIIMATASTDISIAIECMKRGAYDYITKPFNLEELVQSAERALEKRRLVLENNEYRQHLEEKVTEQTRKIRALSLNAITALVNALEAKDEYTSGHSLRVSDIAVAIGREMGLSPETINNVQLAGLVHDIGKIGIREPVLNKPSHLNADEVMHVQRHPEIGEHILKPITDDVELLRLVRNHHEHYDGKGYPDRLKGDSIPVGARILAVSDAYEAMTSERPYRDAMTDDEARAQLEDGKGTQFDPEIVETFLKSQWWKQRHP